MKKIKTEKKRSGRLRTLLLLDRIVICILVAVIACASAALVTVILSQGVTANGRDLETDPIRIYIDQGHNPAPHHNLGAQGNGLYEQDLTFSIGCMLAELLKEDGRFEVCLSRPEESTVLGTDRDSSLQARVDGAAQFEADYFISLHINSFTDDSANGIEVHTARMGDESYAFGKRLLNGMLDATGLKSRGMKQSGDLFVLKHATMPAVLLEMGFISNQNDAAFLQQHPDLFAQGIYDGIVDHFESSYILSVNILLYIIAISAISMIILIVMGKIFLRKMPKGR
ncbi:MAG: N-acetylmuramoyl-L-alanine amidase [Clostridia bacterium]|nr:N-acetylmuramoyl-L-alanine amidase [Clostridia bacterium]